MSFHGFEMQRTQLAAAKRMRERMEPVEVVCFNGVCVENTFTTRDGGEWTEWYVREVKPGDAEQRTGDEPV